MAIVMMIIILALIQYVIFSFRVGMARSRYNVVAPLISGHELFERTYRVQQNTLEQLVLFIPAISILGLLGHEQGLNLWLFTGIPGITWIIGRLIYAITYIRNPATRGPGFVLTILPSVFMLLTSMYLIIKELMQAT